MSRKENDISSLYRRKFKDHKESPSSSVWKGLSRRLFWYDFFRFNPRKINIYYIAGIIVGAGIGLYFSIQQDKNQQLNQDYTVIPDSINEQKLTLTDTGAIEESRKQETPEKQAKTLTETSIDKAYEIQEQPASDDDEAVITKEGERIKSAKDESNISESAIPDEAEDEVADTEFQISPQAYFIPSAFEGCVPLQVSFSVEPGQGLNYEWSFGDGGSSENENPAYIYDEPGNYLVTLTTRDENMAISTYTEEIKVNPSPEVLFEFEVTGDPAEGQPVYFYNYSRGAAEYRWEFGDGTISELEEPTKIYESAGEYDIKLLAISEKGCKDSMILTNAFSGDDPEIVFPNAFTPNPDGPVGGYYSGRESNNDVFHPYMMEEPLQYTLRIFNKNGNLIFESNDPLIGWDGYYRQELQPQGVYIYKVKATFGSGKTVVRMGDVTLIWERSW